jgi:hypothetical protein
MVREKVSCFRAPRKIDSMDLIGFREPRSDQHPSLSGPNPGTPPSGVLILPHPLHNPLGISGTPSITSAPCSRRSTAMEAGGNKRSEAGPAARAGRVFYSLSSP